MPNLFDLFLSRTQKETFLEINGFYHACKSHSFAHPLHSVFPLLYGLLFTGFPVSLSLPHFLSQFLFPSCLRLVLHSFHSLFHSLSLNTHMYSLSLSSPQPLSLFHSVMQQERQQCGMLFALGCKPFCSSIFQVMCVKTLSLTHIPFASGTCSHSS